LETGHEPKLMKDGTSGTYLLEDPFGAPVAIFKPLDEETNCPNNPKGNSKFDSREDLIEPGKQGYREVCASLMAQYFDFHIPKTALVTISTNSIQKVGSLCEFVDANFSKNVADYGSGIFPMREVHLIGVFDILTLNCDRNEENILVRKSIDGSMKLVGIDHGRIIPESLNIAWCDWVWYDWKQCKQGFTPDMLRFIENYDVEDFISKINSVDEFTEVALNNLRLGSLVLKTGVKLGLSLHEIASVIVRIDLDENSDLENLVIQGEEEMKRKNKSKMENDFFEIMEVLIEEHMLRSTTSVLN